MNLLTNNKLSKYIQNLLHADTQLHQCSMDLSVNSIYTFKRPASLDFGGSEFEAAAREEIPSTKKNRDDDYGWWMLQSGLYQASFNETISLGNNKIAIISPHEHAVEAGFTGGHHIITNDQRPLSFNFRVPRVGCNIKENARIATLCIFGM